MSPILDRRNPVHLRRKTPHWPSGSPKGRVHFPSPRTSSSVLLVQRAACGAFSLESTARLRLANQLSIGMDSSRNSDFNCRLSICRDVFREVRKNKFAAFVRSNPCRHPKTTSRIDNDLGVVFLRNGQRLPYTILLKPIKNIQCGREHYHQH